MKAVLSSPRLFKEWREELQLMSGRIKAMRQALYNELVRLNTPSPSGDWKHIISELVFYFTFRSRLPNVC